MYVQNGWLRVSERALNPSLSTPLSPYQTHLLSDRALLAPGVPVYVEIEIFPFDHVFRQGSAIRLAVDTPTQFEILGGTATNDVYLDSTHDSTLTLGDLVGGVAQAPLGSCASTAGQPCRANATPIPTGTLSIPGPSVTIIATPATITFGQSATLYWTSNQVNACTASGSWSGAVPTGGSAAGPPAAPGTYTYNLTCTGPGGSASGSAMLTVGAPTSKASGGNNAGGGGAMPLETLFTLAGIALWRRRSSPRKEATRPSKRQRLEGEQDFR